MSFFLAKKDPEFFRAIVKPYLANKKDKTFLDHWLLEDDLRDYLHPWQHARLNSVERVLLAQRLAGESAKTARHLTDLVRLLPPNLERERMLYETALKAGELDQVRTVRRDARFRRLAFNQTLGLSAGDLNRPMDKPMRRRLWRRRP